MQVTIGSRTYYLLKNLSYAPETDVTSGTVAINEFSVEIVTTFNDIAAGAAAILKDDMQQLWAQFSICEVKRLDAKNVYIRAQSAIAALENRQLDAVLYSLEPLADILTAIFGSSGAYTLGAPLQNKTVSGYAPAQTARDRLQWVLTAVGAYIKQTNNTVPAILPTPGLDVIPLEIPIADTYWRPTVKTTEPYLGLCADAYELLNLPGWKADKTVKIDDVSYLLIARRYWLSGPGEMPFTGTNNPVAKGVTLLSPDNVADVLTAMYPFAFGNRTVEADVINNNDYIPGDIVGVPTTPDGDYVSGAIESASFAFGKQAKSAIRLRERWDDGDDHTPHTLTVEHVFPGDSDTAAMTLATERYAVPGGMAFVSLQPFIYDAAYVMRPVTLIIGTSAMPASDTTQTATCAKALWYDQGTLSLLSVSSFEGFHFYSNSSWAYRKNIVIKRDGVDVVVQNVICFSLAQAQDTPYSKKAMWWPKDYADYIAQQTGTAPVLWQQDPVFQEGGVGCVFREVSKLTIPLSGGGVSEWVAIEEAPNG